MRALDLFRRRIGERQFWVVQAGIAVVTVTHLLLEALTADAVEQGNLAEGLHHIPVALYAVPVAYAGLTYGIEGGVLTGVLAAALSAPAIPLWHADEYAWIGEVLFIAVVIGTGIALSIPVERERRERVRAEAAARRLALVNDITTELARPGALALRAEAALDRVVDVLDAGDAWLSLWRNDTSDAPEELVVAVGHPPPLRPDDDGAFVTRIEVGGVAGELGIVRSAPLLPADDRALVSAVGQQLGIAMENALLHRDEQSRLQTYVRAITRAQEDERKRIARDLHDESAQALAAIARGLDDLRERLDDRPHDAERAAALRRQTRETLEGVRRFSRDLRPTVLDDFGLIAALERLVADLGGRLGLDVRFEVEGSRQRFDPDSEVALFRIVQEALRNIEHHADADRVEVRCRFDDDRLHIEIEDDGRGADVLAPNELVARGHLGITGMRERAELVGATVEVHSSPGSGTLVTADIPRR